MVSQTPARSVFAFLILSVGGGSAFIWTISQRDCHAIVSALGLSWFIMVCVCIGSLTCQMFLELDAKPLHLARWERNGRIYERIGLRVFRSVLLHTQLRMLSSNLELRSGRSGLDQLLRNMESAEGTHAIAGVASLAVSIACALIGHTAIATWLVLITIPFHVYPVTLQRWNRGRVLRLQRRGRGSQRRASTRPSW